MTSRISLSLLFLFPLFIAAQNPGNSALENEAQHELTIYLIPSKVKYDWSSPHALYRSYVKNFKRNLFTKHSYILGHAFLELQSPLIPGRIQTGMRAASREEQKQYVLKEKYGLAILGAEISGRLENSGTLEMKKEKYSRKGQMAFLKILISESAAARMLSFFTGFVNAFDTTGGQGPVYGGAFWPRYQGEGAGCSAFVVSFLDVAGLLRPFFDQWEIKINIPMELIGGPYNEGNEVNFRDIRKYRAWAQDTCEEHQGYEPFEIYDPTLMFEWVENMHQNRQGSGPVPEIIPSMMNEARGIIIDGRDVPVPGDEDLFRERTENSIFIEHYTRTANR